MLSKLNYTPVLEDLAEKYGVTSFAMNAAGESIKAWQGGYSLQMLERTTNSEINAYRRSGMTDETGRISKMLFGITAVAIIEAIKQESVTKQVNSIDRQRCDFELAITLMPAAENKNQADVRRLAAEDYIDFYAAIAELYSKHLR